MPLKGVRTGRDQSVPVDDESLTVEDTAIPLAEIPPSFTYAWVEFQGSAAIRVRFSGTPTASVGHFYAPGQSDVWNPREVSAARFIRATAAAANVFVTYYRDTA